MNPSLKTIVVLTALCLAGCVSTEQLRSAAESRVATAAKAVETDRDPVTTVKVSDGVHIVATPVEYQPPAKGAITLRLDNLPLNMAISALAEQVKIAVNYATGVDTLRPVAADIRDLAPIDAIREVAYLAGYVAVADRPNRITISREATYTFRVPKRLLETITTNLTVSSAGGLSAPTGSGAPSAGTPSAMSVRHSEASSTDANRVRGFLATASGAEVTIFEDGIIVGRGTGTALRRLHNLIDQYTQDALTQIDIELSLLEVTLQNEFQSGIDWSRVIPAGGVFGSSSGNVSVSAGLSTGEALAIRSTSSNITSIVRGLEKVTSINEVTRPRLIAMNHSQKVFRSTVQSPYLPTATTNTTTGSPSSTIQNTGTLAYVEDGLTFSVHANVLDAHRVELKIVPVLTATTGRSRFALGNGVTLEGPIQSKTDFKLEVIAESGKTQILGGLRSSSARDQTSGVPGAVRVPGFNLLLGGHDDRGAAKEVVILVHARIVPAPRYSALVAESV
jgi:MSHA biogenesis protein MshL